MLFLPVLRGPRMAMSPLEAAMSVRAGRPIRFQPIAAELAPEDHHRLRLSRRRRLTCF
jgi:hypothetical protein